MGAAPSPWRPPPDSDAGTFATLSVATVNQFDRTEEETFECFELDAFHEGTKCCRLCLRRHRGFHRPAPPTEPDYI